MKTIIKNQKNVIECECGTVLEYENCDCSLAYSNKSEGLLQIIVKCPNCNKIHKTTIEDLDAINIDNVERIVANKKDYSFLELKNNPELVGVGFQKEIELKNGLKCVVEVAGRYHDIRINGVKTKLSFVLRDLLGKDDDDNMDACMNQTSTNKGGWEKCLMRKKLNNEILNLLPDDLVALIETVRKETYCDGELKITEDKLWLLSETEIFGKTICSHGKEGEQYELFKHYRNRVKGHLGSECSDWYWERSSGSGSTNSFCIVDTSGYPSNPDASNSRGVAFGFCI